MDVHMLDAPPSLSAFSRNIELRVNEGVRTVTASIEKALNKDRVLTHVRDLVLHVTGRFPSTPRRHSLGSPLENVIFLNESRSASTARNLGQENDRLTNDTLPAPSWRQLGTTPESSSNDKFVHLIRSEYGLDSSAKFIVILAQLEVLWQPESSSSANAERTTIYLHVSFEEPVSTFWEMNTAEGLRKGDTFWFAARSPIMTTAVTPSFGDIRLSITAAVDDGPSQHLGAYTLFNILSRSVETERATTLAEGYTFPFLRQVNFIMEGRGAQNLRQLENESAPVRSTASAVQTSENLALVSVTIGCPADLIMSVAKLKTNTQDDIDIRNANHITPSSLSWLDDLIISLEVETAKTRELAARRDSFGYTLADIRQIMEMQVVADDNFGVMEECYLGSW